MILSTGIYPKILLFIVKFWSNLVTKWFPGIYSPVSIKWGDISIVKSVPFPNPKIIKIEYIAGW